jgi:octaprenyl-diphosphate synthase
MNLEYTERLKKIEAELDLWLPQNPDVMSENTEWVKKVFPGLENMIGGLPLKSLLMPLRDIVSRGGKRWRPLLMTLVCETLDQSGSCDSVLPLTPLVEFCHNASLIHDDIEDDSDERRGKPAIHHLYGVDTAINSGSFFYFLSTSCLQAYTGSNKEQVYTLWADYIRRLHLGQAMDISWHSDISFVPEIDEYYTMCGLKTGSLSRLAVELGVYTAGVSAVAEASLAAQYAAEAAEKLGIGFQILDDIKNLTTGIPGKTRGDDIVEGKKSLPVLLYLHKFPEKQGRVFHCFHRAKTTGINTNEVNEMIEILSESGVFTEAEEKAHSLIKEARDNFNSPNYAGIPANKEGRALLSGLIDMISCGVKVKNMVICEIWSILKTSHGNALLLKPRNMDIAVPIFIGTLEMQSILIGKEGMKLPRPHTHDLFLNMLSQVNLSVRRVEVHDLKDDVFHARLIITGGEYTNEKPFILESRPSDAFAIATRKKSPIFLASAVIEQTGVPLDFFISDLEEAATDKFGSLREQLEQAVAEEEYEQAAEIRDLLKMLESDSD